MTATAPRSTSGARIVLATADGLGTVTIMRTACDLSIFDHAAIARGMGRHGIRVEDPSQLAPALKEALNGEKPCVVDVQTSLSESFRRVTSPLATERS